MGFIGRIRDKAGEAYWCATHREECRQTRGAPMARQAYRDIHAGRPVQPQQRWNSGRHRNIRHGDYNPPSNHHHRERYNKHLRGRGYYETRERDVYQKQQIWKRNPYKGAKPVPGQLRLGSRPLPAVANKRPLKMFPEGNRPRDNEDWIYAGERTVKTRQRLPTGRFMEGTRDIAERNRMEEQHRIELFCREYPDRCGVMRASVNAARMRRERGVEEALAAEKKTRNRRIVHGVLDSTPGRALMAAGDSYYEAQHTSRHMAKGAGRALGLGPSQYYMPKVNKIPRKRYKMARRYKMRGRDVMADVDAEMSRIL